MKGQITGILAIVVVGVFVISGSYASFNTTSTSSGNLYPGLCDGIDFKMGSDTIGYEHNPSPLITVSNLLPGHETGVYHIYYWNLPDSLTVTVILNSIYKYWHAGQGVSADNFAKHLWITQGSLDGNPGVQYYWALQIADQAYAGSWANALAAHAVAISSGNYVPTFYGMHQITLHFWDHYNGNDISWPAGQTHSMGFNFMLDPSVGNEYINSGISVTFTASITQFCPPINHPPYRPSHPNPCDNTVNVPVNKVLSWTGGDPDAGDTVTYDVYFGITNPPTTKVSGNQSATTFNPGTLAYNTHYYWKIIAWDNHGAHTVGPIWSFTTIHH